jgi:hypothetical protein
MRKFTALFAAAALAAAALTPAAADARDGRGRGWGGYDRDYGYYDRGYRDHRRDHDDHGDALAAGAVGLVLGLALGSIASQPRSEPPPRYYEQRGYYGGSAYERDYGYEPGYYEPPPRARCMRAERQWDRYAGRYVIVDVPC